MTGTRRHFMVAGAAFAVTVSVHADAEEQPLRRLLSPHPREPKGTITPQRFSAAGALIAINAVREARGRPALVLHGTLNALAAHQAKELKALKQMTHAPRGMQLKERAALVGYRGQVAENLADGYETFEEAIVAWRASATHRTTMLSDRYTRFGAAVAIALDAVPGDWGIYWVTEFGN